MSVPLLFAEFAEYLTVLMSALVDGELFDSLSFKLLESKAQGLSGVFEFQFALGDFE